MSLNKMKSLRLQRSNSRCETTSKIEDTAIKLEEESKMQMERLEIGPKNESLTPLHSTPKRSSIKANSAQDQSGIEYRVSPILLPCTQDGGNEVAWDWQSPLTKKNIKRSKINPEPIGTPKRTTLLQKKRNSNSPLLYKPIKRKLIRNDLQQESIDKFTAEMKALSEQIKTEPRDDNCIEKSNSSEDELLVPIDIADFVENETKFQLTTSDNNSDHNNIQKVVKTSIDDLFDDSIEDSMVKCSQEVEEKLRLESCRDNSSKQNSTSSTTSTRLSPSSWHQNSYSRCLTSREKSVEESKNISKTGNAFGQKKIQTATFETQKTLATAKNLSSSNSNSVEDSKKSSMNSNLPKSSCINNNISKVSKTTFNPTISTQNDFFDIPDDSFDDIIAVCVDDVEKSMAKIEPQANQSNGRYGKVYVSPHSNVQHENSRRLETSTAKRILLPPASQSSCNVTKISSSILKTENNVNNFSRSVSNDNIKPDANKQRESEKMTSITTSNNQGRKFFKTKSLSTSSFDEQDNIVKNGNTANSSLSSKGWKSSFLTNCSVSTSVSNSQSKTVKNELKNDVCINNLWSKENGKNGNREICNFDRNGTKEENNVKVKKLNGIFVQDEKKNLTISSQNTQKCTPEEIERKRLEAKMKLEAKRKLMARSTSTGALRQVKR